MSLSAPFKKAGVKILTGVIAVSLGACATSPTGRKQLKLLPESQLQEMGVQSFQQMKSEIPQSQDPKTREYVQCVTQPLLQALGDRSPVKEWEIVVFKDDTANAFALPGGKIGVHTGLLKVAGNSAQLAAVIGHEIGHVLADHGNERVSQALATQGGLMAAGAIAGDSTQSQVLMAALGLGAQVGVLLPFSRAQESESDTIGLNLMAEAGFDPRQSVELWQNMKKAAGGQSPPEFLSTHPSSDTRMQKLRDHMGEAMAVYSKTQQKGAQPQCKAP